MEGTPGGKVLALLARSPDLRGEGRAATFYVGDSDAPYPWEAYFLQAPISHS